MVGVRILECSSHYYLLRHQLYCRSMLKIVPITNDFFTQRPYHDLASAKSKWQISFCFYNEHTNLRIRMHYRNFSSLRYKIILTIAAMCSFFNLFIHVFIFLFIHSYVHSLIFYICISSFIHIFIYFINLLI